MFTIRFLELLSKPIEAVSKSESRKMSRAKVSAITVSPKFREKLVRAYADRFGRSPSNLLEALNHTFISETKGIGNLIGDKTLRNFFNADEPVPMYEKNLNYLCKVLLHSDSYRHALEINDNKIEEQQLSNFSPSPLKEIDIWGEWLDYYRKKIRRNCDNIHVLDMTEALKLQDLYVDVYFWKSIKSRRTKDYHDVVTEQLTPRTDGENPQILSPYEASQPKTFESLAEIKRCSRLLIYGDPGAGKTIFLKKLALRYLDANVSADDFGKSYMPIFIRFKHLADEISSSNLAQVAVGRFADDPDSNTIIMEMLRKGRCILLLDALDEAGSYTDNVCEKVDEFLRKYPDNRVVMTCRKNCIEHKFDGFTEVEIASFSWEQTRGFATNWFAVHSEKDGDVETNQKDLKEFTERFLTDLANDESTKRLSTRPLLLTYLCLVFRENNGFPKSRAAIFSDVVDILLWKWDAARKVKRRPTSEDKLTPAQKVSMLGEISYDGLTSVPIQFVWKEAQLSEKIRKYMQKVSLIKEDEIDVNTETILDLIVRDSGLLFETAKKIYTFPYITIQEFLSAEFVYRMASVNQSIMRDTVKNYFSDPQWQQVFLILADRLPQADQFFKLCFTHVNALSKSKAIQEMLTWLDRITSSCDVAGCGWRAMTLTIALDTHLYISSENKVTNEYAQELVIDLQKFNIERGSAISNQPKARLVLDHLSVLLTLAEEITHPLSRNLLKANSFILNRLGIHKVESESAIETEGKPNISSLIDSKLKLAIKEARESKLPDLEKELVSLNDSTPSDEENIPEWQVWGERLKDLSIKHLDIGHNIHFSDEECKALDKYLYANNLLLKCIRDVNISTREIRMSIIDHMLLPSDRIPGDLFPS
jgi:hypothetical protein